MWSKSRSHCWLSNHSLLQYSNEPLQQCVANLQAKAACLYNFNTTCKSTKTVSYAESMVMDQMLLGLWENYIQGEVLAQDSQLKAFSACHDYIHAIEEGKHPRATLGSCHPKSHAHLHSYYQSVTISVTKALNPCSKTTPDQHPVHW